MMKWIACALVWVVACGGASAAPAKQAPSGCENSGGEVTEPADGGAPLCCFPTSAREAGTPAPCLACVGAFCTP